ncbi:MAG: four helix bundle protein [Candidatus Marinimicrobia bacterium]|nr:four helix bundle protein [Candidatus Neomarinimicrobiota bacterium]
MTDYTKYRNINRGYMKLDVWQKGILLHKLVFKTVYKDNKIDFKIRAQIPDSAQSVSSNIAEGYCRRSIKEYLQFLYISLASLGETLTRGIGLVTTEQITSEQFKRIDELQYEVENKLLKLVESLENKKDSGSWNNRISEDLEEYSTHE